MNVKDGIKETSHLSNFTDEAVRLRTDQLVFMLNITSLIFEFCLEVRHYYKRYNFFTKARNYESCHTIANKLICLSFVIKLSYVQVEAFYNSF